MSADKYFILALVACFFAFVIYLAIRSKKATPETPVETPSVETPEAVEPSAPAAPQGRKRKGKNA